MGLSWGCLGLFGAILGVLGASWVQERFRNPRPDFTVPRAKDLDLFWGPFWGPKLAQNSLFGGSFLGPVFEHFLEHFWGHFGTHFGTRSGQEGANMCPRGPSKTPKTQKVAFAPTFKTLEFFKVFGVQRPKKATKRHPKSSKTQQKRDPKMDHTIIICLD